jgi:hypothetical protein
MDEAGHTGENLLDSDQPVYALAAVQMDEATARAAVSDALSRAPATMTELKFSVLRRSGAGRRNLLTLLHDLGLTPEDAAIIVMHKPFMVATKLIDELVEPRMLAKGLQPVFYAGGAAKNMAHALNERAPRALGEMYEELTGSFVAMVRDYSPEAGTAFLRTLQRCKIVSRDEEVSDLLAVMIDTPGAIDEAFAGRHDVLDPALPSLFWQGGYWSSKLQTRFEVLHDDSRSVSRWQDEIFSGIQRNMADRTAPQTFQVGDRTVHVPTLLDRIRFKASHDDPRLQVADVLAGAAAYGYEVVTGTRRDEGGLLRLLQRAGITELLQEGVIPDHE